MSYLTFGAKVYAFSRDSKNFMLKVVKGLGVVIKHKKRGLSPLRFRSYNCFIIFGIYPSFFLENSNIWSLERFLFRR